MPPAPPAVPGAYDFARVAWFQGRDWQDDRAGAGRRRWRKRRLQRLDRQSARAALCACPGSVGGRRGRLAAAFVAGDQGAIPEADADAMRRSGLAHLLSVSGLHVTAVVAGAMFLLMRLLALSPRLALHAPLLLIAAGGGALAGIA